MRLMTNLEHSSLGYMVADGTDPAICNFYGFTPLTECEISAVAPPSVDNLQRTAYTGDEAGLAGKTIPAGLYLPIRGASLTLASGTAILWRE